MGPGAPQATNVSGLLVSSRVGLARGALSPPTVGEQDRMAPVVSGDWQLGYGTHFDEKLLKMLPAGSVYSEAGGVNHFTRSG